MFTALGLLLILTTLGIMICQAGSVEEHGNARLSKELSNIPSTADVTHTCYFLLLSKRLTRWVDRFLSRREIPDTNAGFLESQSNEIVVGKCIQRNEARATLCPKSPVLNNDQYLVEQQLSLSLVRTLISTRKKGIQRVDSLERSFAL